MNIETNLIIDVIDLDAEHRVALEDVIGLQLQSNQRLLIRVTDVEELTTATNSPRPQTLEDWKRVYEGLTDEQIDELIASPIRELTSLAESNNHSNSIRIAFAHNAVSA